jgi:hypothetical protein
MQDPFDVHVDVWAANTEWLDVRMSTSKEAAQKLKQLRRTTGDDALHPGTEVSREDVAEKVAADHAAGLRLSIEGGRRPGVWQKHWQKHPSTASVNCFSAAVKLLHRHSCYALCARQWMFYGPLHSS